MNTFSLRRRWGAFPVLLNSEPIIKNNKIVGARGIVIDISERKDIERGFKNKNVWSL